MIAVDSSVAIAAFATWNQHHRVALDFLNAEHEALLPAHAALETYSVLTRLPQPYRATAAVVGEFLDSWFGGELAQLPPAEHAAFRQRLVALGIAGGAVYDALIAWTARHIGASLATLDKRASTTYEQLGVDVRPIAD